MPVRIEVRVRVVTGRKVLRTDNYLIERDGESVEVRLYNVQDGKLYGHYLGHQGEVIGEALRPAKRETLQPDRSYDTRPAAKDEGRNVDDRIHEAEREIEK